MNLFIPFFGMMILTLAVWIYMYILRLSWIASHKPDHNLISTPEKMAQMLPERINYPSYNLKNLFELPVLFYAVCLYLGWAGTTDNVDIYCAYGFLILRIMHSAIHCTVNIVPLRFTAYFLSAIFLWIMILRAAYPLLYV